MKIKQKYYTGSELRTHSVNVRFNIKELQELDMLREQRTRAAFVRDAFFEHAPPPIPEINRKAYVELSRAANDIYQISRNIDEAIDIDFDEIQFLLYEFRLGLLTLRDKE